MDTCYEPGQAKPPAPPSVELTEVLERESAGRALDLACGSGRHAAWLAERGWDVTAVDQNEVAIPGVRFVKADLENQEFVIAPAGWDLIVCWLYWQRDLLPSIARGVRPGGIAALAGKTSGRFATSIDRFRAGFPGWAELVSGAAGERVWFVARAPLQ
jgi:SAM-dependent methyltransferase